MPVGNFILILLCLAGVAAGIWWYFTKTRGIDDDYTDYVPVETLSIPTLIKVASHTINNYLKQDLRELNISKAQLMERNAAKANLRASLKEAAYGNPEAKRVVKEYIKYAITANGDTPVTQANIDEIIPFNDPSSLRGDDKFFILLQHYMGKYGRDGLPKMFRELGLDGERDITDELVSRAFDKAEVSLTYAEKLDYIAQKVFQGYKGFGVADMLFEASVDEIDAGVSGIPKQGFELKSKALARLSYSYESIWILLHGVNVHLSCLSFGSDEELIRVCQNVYKYNAQKVFSRKAGYVVSSMKDGSRVVVTRPPFSDKWAFYVRKFDSAPSVDPEKLITDRNAQIAIRLVKWLIKGQRNIAVTGQQGTGKTTALKSFINFIDNLNIRTQELAFELHLSFAFPDKNISSFQETTTVTAQDGLNLQKKTNGAVNIVGEVATAEQAGHIIQTAMVASLFAMFTHHAKTAADLVNSIALNLLQLGLYKEKKDAVEMAAKILHIDIHLVNVDGKRYIERITEIIPVTGQEYPSEAEGRVLDEESLREDTREFYKRITDRQLFITQDIVRWDNGAFMLVNLPSEDMLSEIKSKLMPDEREEFEADLAYFKELTETEKKNREAA